MAARELMHKAFAVLKSTPNHTVPTQEMLNMLTANGATKTFVKKHVLGELKRQKKIRTILISGAQGDHGKFAWILKSNVQAFKDANRTQAASSASATKDTH